MPEITAALADGEVQAALGRLDAFARDRPEQGYVWWLLTSHSFDLLAEAAGAHRPPGVPVLAQPVYVDEDHSVLEVDDVEPGIVLFGRWLAAVAAGDDDTSIALWQTAPRGEATTELLHRISGFATSAAVRHAAALRGRS